jgi:hypothetical protein
MDLGFKTWANPEHVEGFALFYVFLIFFLAPRSQAKYFERGIWFKDKACSFDSSGGVLLYVEHWAKLRNAVIEPKNRSINCAGG